MNFKDILAVIPARSGSKGVINKNIKPLANYPLLVWSILAAKRLGISEIYLSTDSYKYAEIGKKYGAEVPELRPDSLSTDTSTDSGFMRHAIEMFSNNGKNFKYVVHLRPTTPSRNVHTLQNAIARFASNSKPYLRSCHPASESPLKWYYNRNGMAQQLSEVYNVFAQNQNRQLFETVYVPNGYIDILNVDHFMKHDDLYETEVVLFETEPVVEIDTQFEHDLVTALSNTSHVNIYKDLLNV